MLEDIQKITKILFDEFIRTNNEVKSTKNLYDIYRSLQKVIDNINLVSKHYLALNFTEEYLQNSSFRETSDKWRWAFNKDLEKLNDSVKSYLLDLYYLSIKAIYTKRHFIKWR